MPSRLAMPPMSGNFKLGDPFVGRRARCNVCMHQRPAPDLEPCKVLHRAASTASKIVATLACIRTKYLFAVSCTSQQKHKRAPFAEQQWWRQGHHILQGLVSSPLRKFIMLVMYATWTIHSRICMVTDGTLTYFLLMASGMRKTPLWGAGQGCKDLLLFDLVRRHLERTTFWTARPSLR